MLKFLSFIQAEYFMVNLTKGGKMGQIIFADIDADVVILLADSVNELLANFASDLANGKYHLGAKRVGLILDHSPFLLIQDLLIEHSLVFSSLLHSFPSNALEASFIVSAVPRLGQESFGLDDMDRFLA